MDNFKFSVGRARDLAGCARAGGIDVLFGTTFELGPGLLVVDVVTPVPSYTGGEFPVPLGPGLGVALDAGKLETLNATTIE